MSVSDLRKKYGDRAASAGRDLQPTTFARRLAQRDRLDQHFTRLWLDFQILGMSRRTVLDTRTRLLVQIGQFTMAKAHRALEDGIRAALAANVPTREVLETILHCVIYGGELVVDPAIDIFERVADELGLLEELEASQLPLEGNDSKRSLEAERESWHPEDVKDPSLPDLIDRHGWLGISCGLRLRPKHHLLALGWQDAIDTEWAGLWERFNYQGLYSRGIVDDKTRLLCMVGNCIAIGEEFNARAHMRGAMRAGASPREVIEVILQSAPNFGMPAALLALRVFHRIMKDDDRLEEIGNPPELTG